VRASGDEDSDEDVNLLRPSCIVKSSDDEDTDVRWLDIIPQLDNNQLDEDLGLYKDEQLPSFGRQGFHQST